MPKIKLYTTKSCPFRIAAKNLLKIKNLRFEEIDLTSRTELRLEFSTKYNWRTGPLIIIDDKFIGGFDELDKLNDEGKLV